jgi:ribosomal protein S18 acetylase RimI-like enzyme
MKLRESTIDDLNIIITWIPDKESWRLWAGPYVTYPCSVEGLKEDIRFSGNNSFSLISDKYELIGFGQIFEKNNRLHLARIIIAPEYRGKGFGKRLCKCLIQEGIKRFGIREFSLNVYTTNKSAYNLYSSLGFYLDSAPKKLVSDHDNIYMVMNPDKRSSG